MSIDLYQVRNDGIIKTTSKNLYSLTKWLNFAVKMQNDTEQIILETARKHFIQKGFSSARMQEIADDAKINKALLHYYFRTKEKLYQQVISYTLGKVVPTLVNSLKQNDNFWISVENLVETYITTILKNPE